MGIDSEELKSFVSSTIDSIEQGIEGKSKKYCLSGGIKFEIAVVSFKKGEGGIKLFVVDASGKVGNENTSKITFEIKPYLAPAGRFG
jgi:hypothetical protein